MKHYGDITKINGAVVEPVNVIIGGSPCQDLSTAGKQKGIKHTDNADSEITRSGLFIEQLRIIKEMRRKDIEHGRTGTNIRPRFMVWENVPGAFSSNKGDDFASVLEETIRIVCEKAPYIPTPKNGWTNAGCFTDMGGQWSLAWRVLDAQFWGVPQRRKRIALIADFGGLSAPEILFERGSVFGDIEPCESQREVSAAETNGCTGEAVRAFCFQNNGIDQSVAIFNPGEMSRLPSNYYWEHGICPTLRAAGGDNRPAIVLENHPNDSRIGISEGDVVQTLSARMGTGGNNTLLIMTAPPRNIGDLWGLHGSKRRNMQHIDGTRL